MISKFEKASGFKTGSKSRVYTCDECGKRTRNTGDEGSVNMCRFCFETSEQVNAYYDGAITLEVLKASIAAIEKKEKRAYDGWDRVLSFEQEQKQKPEIFPYPTAMPRLR